MAERHPGLLIARCQAAQGAKHFPIHFKSQEEEEAMANGKIESFCPQEWKSVSPDSGSFPPRPADHSREPRLGPLSFTFFLFFSSLFEHDAVQESYQATKTREVRGGSGQDPTPHLIWLERPVGSSPHFDSDLFLTSGASSLHATTHSAALVATAARASKPPRRVWPLLTVTSTTWRSAPPFFADHAPLSPLHVWPPCLRVTTCLWPHWSSAFLVSIVRDDPQLD